MGARCMYKAPILWGYDACTKCQSYWDNMLVQRINLRGHDVSTKEQSNIQKKKMHVQRSNLTCIWGHDVCPDQSMGARCTECIVHRISL